jgi:hypothetical protein
MTPENVQQYGLAFVTIAGALTTAVVIPVAVQLLPVVLTQLAPLLRDRIKGARDKVAFDAVSRAGVRASSVAAEVYVALIAKASDPSSEDGVNVTQNERDAAWSACLRAAWEDIDRQGLRESVTKAYGGTGKVEQAVVAIIRNALFGKPQG